MFETQQGPAARGAFALPSSGKPGPFDSDWPAQWWSLGLSPAELAAGSALVPDWASFLMTALGDAGDSTPAAVRSPAGAPVAGAEVFEPVVRILLDETDRLLEKALGSDQLAGGILAAALQCRSVLAARVTRTVMRTLVAELADRVALAPGSDLAEHRHLDELLRQRSTAPGLQNLLLTHPVLARLVGIQCLGHVAALIELVQRLSADLPAIGKELAGSGATAVRQLQIGTGDVHRGGRSVAVVQFTDGSRVVYKPRSGNVQTHLRTVLDWYRSALPLWAPRLPRTLPRLGYCWEEFIPALPCADHEAVERFYRRQGSLLALLYVLGCTDVHYENVIAHGDEPVVIDIETVFHPVVVPESVLDDPAAQALVGSVARTGLLPLIIEGETERVDVSGLGGGVAGPSPHAVPTLQATGTDGMYIERRIVELPETPNRPLLNGARMEPADYSAALLAGFRAGYDVLSREADTVLELVGTCSGDEVRVVVRDTYLYAAVLDESTHPELLADAPAHDRFLRRVAELNENPDLDPLLDGEVAELWNSDIPVMITTPGSHTIRSAHPLGASCAVELTALEATEATLQQLSARDRRAQEWVIEAALATRGPELRHVAGARSEVHSPGDADPDHLIAQACGIADELCAAMRHGAERVNWLGLEPADGAHWSLAPMGAGLGDGYTGVALFLLAAHRLTGIKRYADVAARAVTGLPALITDWERDEDAAGDIGGGAMDGLGGIAWAVAHLSSVPGVLPDGVLGAVLRVCRQYVDNVALARSAEQLSWPADTAAQLAGLTVTLRSVGASAVGSGDAVLASQTAGRAARLLPPITTDKVTGGALHGSAALAWARGGETSATPARPDTEDGDPSWCSGLSGRLAVLASTPADWGLGVRALERLGPLDTHAPCHGELGVLEGLLALNERGSARAGELLRRRSSVLLSAVAARGPRCGTPGAVSTPGFLHGLAGIGYGLLRIADPSRVPSVLLFHPVGRPAAAIK